MAWTIVETLDAQPVTRTKGEELITITLTCTSDASTTDYDISEHSMKSIRGGYLYEMKVVPGSGGDAPTGTFDIDIEDEDDAHILDTNANSNTAITFHDGAGTIGHYPVVGKQLSFVSATLGDANTAVVYLKVLK